MASCGDLTRRSLTRAGALGAVALVAMTLTGVLPASAEPPMTIEPGKLTIGINGDMPMTSLKDGKLSADAENLRGALEDFGLPSR